MPNCKYINSLFGDVIDNCVSEETLRSFNTHICICKQCSLRYKKMRGIVDDVRSLPKAELPTNFHEILMSKTAQRRKQKRLLSFVNLKNVSAAAVVVCLVSFVAVILGSSAKGLNFIAIRNPGDKGTVQKSSVDFIADGSAGVVTPNFEQNAAGSADSDIGYENREIVSHNDDAVAKVPDYVAPSYSSDVSSSIGTDSGITKDYKLSLPQDNKNSGSNTAPSSEVKKPSGSNTSSESKTNTSGSISTPKPSSAPSSTPKPQIGSQDNQNQSGPSPKAEVLSSVRTSSRTILVAESLFNQKVASGEISVMNSFFESGVYKVVVSSSDFSKISQSAQLSGEDKYVFVVESIN